MSSGPWQVAALSLASGALFLFSCGDAEVTAQERQDGRASRDLPGTSLPPKAAAMLQRFENARYARTYWVDADAAAGGDGSARAPFATINAALRRARPCTEIRVATGTYAENVRFERNLDGASDCPIRLVSFEGAGMAKIVAPDPLRSAVSGGGSENIMVEGFAISGGKNGVQFGQNGADWTDLARNIVIRFNTIENPVDDGVKINGAETVVIAHNAMSGGKDEAIDLFGALDVGIVRNRLGPMKTPSGALTIKAGSRGILVSGNRVQGISSQGIVVGGRTGLKLRPRAGFESFEADQVRVYGNRVENVGKTPLAFLGATNSHAWSNLLVAGARSPAIVVTHNLPVGGSRMIMSGGIRGWSNRFIAAGRAVRVDPAAIDVRIDEQSAGKWDMVTGPDMKAFRP